MSRSGDRNLNSGSGNADEKTGGRGICKCLVTQRTGEWIRSRERIRKKEKQSKTTTTRNKTKQKPLISKLGRKENK